MSNQEILLTLPHGVERVLVKTPDGKKSYKLLAEVTDEDEIQLKKDGTPIGSMNPVGRPPIGVAFTLSAGDPGGVKRAQMDSHIHHDVLVSGLRKDQETSEVLSQVLREISQDIARIDYLRAQVDPDRRAEIADLTIKRIKALGQFYDTLFRRYEISLEKNVPDVRSPAVKEVVRYLLETVREMMIKVKVRAETIDSVFNELGPTLSDPTWESQLKSRMEKASTK